MTVIIAVTVSIVFCWYRQSFAFYTEDIADKANSYSTGTVCNEGQCVRFVQDVLEGVTGKIARGWWTQADSENGLTSVYGAVQINPSEVIRGDIIVATNGAQHIAVVTYVEHDSGGNITSLTITDCNHCNASGVCDGKIYINTPGYYLLSWSTPRFWRVGEQRPTPTPTPTPQEPNDYPTFSVFQNRLYQAARRPSDNAVLTRYTVDGETWTSWESNGGTRGSVSMLVYDGKLYQAIGGATSNFVYTRSYSIGTGWSSWDSNGGTQANVSMVEYRNRLYQAVGGASSQGVFTRSYTSADGWSEWESNGATQDDVSMIVYDDRLFQAIGGANSQGVFTRSYSPEQGWSPWELNGATQDNVTMAVYDGKLYQAVGGANSQGVFTRSYSSETGWNDWEQNGGTQGNVSMIVYKNKLFQAISGKTSNSVYTRYYSAEEGWSVWVANGGTTEDVGMIVFYDRLYQAVRGITATDHIYTRYTTDGIAWTDWVRDDQGSSQAPILPITANNGGTAVADDGIASVLFPGQTVSEDIVVTITKYQNTLLGSGRFYVIGDVYDFIAYNAPGNVVTEFLGNVTLTFQYHPNELDGIPETNLRIFYYHEPSGEWRELSSNVDTINHRIHGSTNHFTKFAIGALIADEGGYLLWTK